MTRKKMMDDPQEFKSLDELFRKTFDELPDQPAASGWDAPSPRVWEQVRTQIPTPSSGWTGKSILLISGLAIVLMLGLYWALSSPAATDHPSTNPEQTTASALPKSDTPDADQPVPIASSGAIGANKSNLAAQTQSKRKSETEIAGNTNLPKSNSTDEESGMQRRLPGSAPLPGTNPASPNTTIRRQMEIWRGAPWAQPLAPLPSILESKCIRPVPESLKKLGN